MQTSFDHRKFTGSSFSLFNIQELICLPSFVQLHIGEATVDVAG